MKPDFYLDIEDNYIYRTLEEAKDRGCIESELTPVYTTAPDLRTELIAWRDKWLEEFPTVAIVEFDRIVP